ncbi:MAG: metallophosphoesterase family protein [Akkermansia sp.]|nr:metallophosphoesterase family protein [Akkermansia sp.]
MKIAILSDIHDHTNHLLSALATAEITGCERMLFLGDMVHASTFSLLLEEWEKPLDLVFGNNEYEEEAFSAMAAASRHATLHGEYGVVKCDGQLLFFCHLPQLALRALETKQFDAVFYGHTHCAECRQLGTTLLANPGEVLGRSSIPGIGVYDTETREFLHYSI